MKPILFSLMLCISAGNAWAESVRLAVTTSFNNSGLAEVLLPEVSADLGIDLQVLVVGTGQALRLGEAGDVDAVLVHAEVSEKEFVAAEHATHRREIMYNDFVIIGPSDDPAKLSSAGSALEALGQIADTNSLFVSRGDDSGTHKKELMLWDAIDRTTEEFGRWYLSVGAGMGTALNVASGKNAYVLSDRASWLKFENKGELMLLFEGDERLFNQYSYLPISPARHPHVPASATAELEEWLVGPRARDLINGYQVDGVPLFTHNAQDRLP